jgi:hypothetical protein
VNSVAFLRAFHPAGPWVLTAIPADGKQIETRSFTPKSTSAATKWITKNDGIRNLYFSVNLPNRMLDKKATRADIYMVPWLHVDIDARAGEDLSSELERIRLLLTENCPTLPPTAIVYSGGGYQAFWRLAEPVIVDGQVAAAEDVARYNKQLEIELGGDSCSNVDRIMRLPDTMNLPSAKKVERGRTPVRAEVYSFDSDRIYQLSQFSPAPPVQIGGVNSEVIPEATANVARLNSVDDLDKWRVPDRVKIAIVQGFDPDMPKEGDNSRSAWLFDVLCQLIRADVPDDIIYSVITDPDFGISQSVLDKAPNHTKYALRQIQRAKEEVEEPWLRKLNEKFLVIGNLGGKCRVVEEVYDSAMHRSRMTKQTFGDFTNRFSHVYITIGKKIVPVGVWWLRHPKRRQFEYLVFRPGNDAPDAYNLWQGFGCSAISGTKHESFMQHLLNNICGGNQIYYEYLLGWMARAVQQPDSPGETAVVLRGKSGTGKSFFAKHFGKLWGRHFLQVSDAKHLVGAFNAHLRDCVVLFGDEAFFAGDKKHESVLKTLITEEHMMIEHKGVDAEVSPNFTHLILASNSEWVVPTGASERRFFVLDVADDHRQDSHYFQSVANDLAAGGYESLLHFLLSYELADFNVRRVPLTMALMEQKMYSMDPFQEWWYVKLSEGTLLASRDRYDHIVKCQDLLDDYVVHVAKFAISRRGSQTRLGRFLVSVCPPGYPRRYRGSEGTLRPYFYEFPPLAELRRLWETLYGSRMAWPKEVAPGAESAQQDAF